MPRRFKVRLSNAFRSSWPNITAGELEPRFPDETWREELDDYAQVARAEGEYIEAVRREIRPLLADIPSDVDEFIEWFEELKHTGPGQGDPFFRGSPKARQRRTCCGS